MFHLSSFISFHPPPGPDLISSSGTSAGINKNNGYQGEVKARGVGGIGGGGRGRGRGQGSVQQCTASAVRCGDLGGFHLGEAPLSRGACSGGATPSTFHTFARS